MLAFPFFFFFFNDTATTEIYTLSLHDALPILGLRLGHPHHDHLLLRVDPERGAGRAAPRSEEHTSELQSHSDLVCRLLLEKNNYNPSQYDLLKKYLNNGDIYNTTLIDTAIC